MEAQKTEGPLDTLLSLIYEGREEWRHIRTSLETLKSNHETLTHRVLIIEDWSRKPFPHKTIQTYIDVIAKYFNGVCPCCGENQKLNGLGGRDVNLEVDHFKDPSGTSSMMDGRYAASAITNSPMDT